MNNQISEIAGYTVVSKEKLLKNDLFEKFKLLYLLDKRQFNNKLSGTGVVVDNLKDVEDLVTVIQTGRLKGFNFNQFANSIKLNYKDIAKQKIKII